MIPYSKNRNKPTNYGKTITIRLNDSVFEKFKKVCELKGKNYNQVIRDLIDYYLRQNN